MVHSVLTAFISSYMITTLRIYIYHGPAGTGWRRTFRCLAWQCPLVSPLLSGGSCLSVSLGRRVLDGPPQRWLYHPCRSSWCLSGSETASLYPAVTMDSSSSTWDDWTRSVLQQSLNLNLDSLWTAAAVPFIPSMPAGSDTTCLHPGQHSWQATQFRTLLDPQDPTCPPYFTPTMVIRWHHQERTFGSSHHYFIHKCCNSDEKVRALQKITQILTCKFLGPVLPISLRNSIVCNSICIPIFCQRFHPTYQICLLLSWSLFYCPSHFVYTSLLQNCSLQIY